MAYPTEKACGFTIHCLNFMLPPPGDACSCKYPQQAFTCTSSMAQLRASGPCYSVFFMAEVSVAETGFVLAFSIGAGLPDARVACLLAGMMPGMIHTATMPL